jgi:hypothetical protein
MPLHWFQVRSKIVEGFSRSVCAKLQWQGD